MEQHLLLAAYVIVLLSLTGVASATLWWMLHAWRTPAVLDGTGFAWRSDRPELSFSLIVPARHEEAVLGETLLRLADLDHPDVEIIAVVGHDDPDTREVAELVAAQRPDRVRVV